MTQISDDVSGIEQETPDEQADHPNMKRCRFCGEWIFQNALICKECKSYQDWRGAIPVSSSFLALLVAAISVTTTGAQVYSTAPWSQRADVVLQAPTIITGPKIALIATNTGSIPAVIEGLLIEARQIPKELQGDEGKLYLQPATAQDLYIAPGFKQIAFVAKTVPRSQALWAKIILRDSNDRVPTKAKITYSVRSRWGDEQKSLSLDSSELMVFLGNLAAPG